MGLARNYEHPNNRYQKVLKLYDGGTEEFPSGRGVHIWLWQDGHLGIPNDPDALHVLLGILTLLGDGMNPKRVYLILPYNRNYGSIRKV